MRNPTPEQLAEEGMLLKLAERLARDLDRVVDHYPVSYNDLRDLESVLLEYAKQLDEPASERSLTFHLARTAVQLAQRKISPEQALQSARELRGDKGPPIADAKLLAGEIGSARTEMQRALRAYRVLAEGSKAIGATVRRGARGYLKEVLDALWRV